MFNSKIERIKICQKYRACPTMHNIVQKNRKIEMCDYRLRLICTTSISFKASVALETEFIF